MAAVWMRFRAELRAMERHVRALRAKALYSFGEYQGRPPRKLTLSEVAERVGVAQSTVSRYLDELGVPRRRPKA